MYVAYKFLELASFIMLGIVCFKVCRLVDYYTKQARLQNQMMKITIEKEKRARANG